MTTKHPLTEKIKAKWVKALRSGRYVQGTEELKGFGGFCCMGVLQDVAPLKSVTSLGLLCNDEDTCLRLREAVQGYCIKWNDTQQLSFDKIADKIEAIPLEDLI